MTSIDTETRVSLGYDDLPHLMSLMTGDEKHSAAATSTLDVVWVLYDRVLVPGVEISSGSLGHGLPLAVGSALGVKAQGLDARVVVLVGDAELDEGSNHEAIELAGAMGLEQLTVVVVDNRSSTWNEPGLIARRFGTEGWGVVTVDGRDHAQLERALALRAPGSGRPDVVVAEVEAR